MKTSIDDQIRNWNVWLIPNNQPPCHLGIWLATTEDAAVMQACTEFGFEFDIAVDVIYGEEV